MKATGRWNYSRWNKTLLTYTFANGSYIEFFSADQEERLRGARRNILYINECNNVDFESYYQLAIRTSGDIYLDFNPTHEFWAHTEVLRESDSDLIILNYLDNEALPDTIKSDIEQAREKAKTSDYWANWWKVYGLGEVGNLQGAIFSDWELGDFDKSLPYYYGLDFGYVNDPDACVKVAIDEKKELIYLEEVFYKKRQKIGELCETVKQLPKGQIVADSAEQRLIDYLRANAGRSIRAVKKGQGSVMQGLKLMQNYKIIVCGRSDNLIKELRNYIWSDKTKLAPIDAWNHIIDSARYVVFTYSARKSASNNRYEDKNTRFTSGDFVGSRNTPW